MPSNAMKVIATYLEILQFSPMYDNLKVIAPQEIP